MLVLYAQGVANQEFGLHGLVGGSVSGKLNSFRPPHLPIGDLAVIGWNNRMPGRMGEERDGGVVEDRANRQKTTEQNVSHKWSTADSSKASMKAPVFGFSHLESTAGSWTRRR